MKDLKRLKSLSLGMAFLIGVELSNSLQGLSKLEDLTLTLCGDANRLPQCIAPLSNLRHLHLQGGKSLHFDDLLFINALKGKNLQSLCTSDIWCDGGTWRQLLVDHPEIADGLRTVKNIEVLEIKGSFWDDNDPLSGKYTLLAATNEGTHPNIKTRKIIGMKRIADNNRNDGRWSPYEADGFSPPDWD